MQTLRRILALWLLPWSSAQAAIPPSPCIEAAHRAAEVTGVPADLLVAITLTETRHSGTAWPWTINHAGDGTWYPTRAEAEAAARALAENGAAFDAGCFQINTGWHPDAFTSVEAMFDPDANALYAARFLRDLHASSGDWADAVATYNAGDPQLGQAYLMRVGRVLAELRGPDATGAVTPARRNGFPLLAPGEPVTHGSLVPRLSRRTPLVGAP